jgi:hypothetical protein
MGVTAITSEGRMGNRLVLTGTATCTNSGETIALADTKSRIISFWAVNSDGQESPEITLNSNNGTEDTANGSVRMVHGGASGDVWNFEATLV